MASTGNKGALTAWRALHHSIVSSGKPTITPATAPWQKLAAPASIDSSGKTLITLAWRSQKQQVQQQMEH